MSRTAGSALKSLISKFGTEVIEACWLCGLRCPGILQISHLNQNNEDNRPQNLACLCPTCHRLFDVDLVSRRRLILGGRALRAGNAAFDVQKLWNEIEILSKKQKADWGVLFKKNKSRGTLAALKAHATRKLKIEMGKG